MQRPNQSFTHLVLPIIAVVIAINFLTMPAEEYVGDAMAVRVETISLLDHGKWAVPPDIAINSGPAGQYFYLNARGNWYPKYGVFNTLIYLPALTVVKLTTGNLTFESNNILYLNLLNLVLSGATALYLTLLARRYTKSAFITWVFVLASLYATFWWNYLRAQTFEIYLTLFLLGFFYHFVRARDCDCAAALDPKCSHRHLLISAIYLGLLCLSKTVYVILLPPIIVFLALRERVDSKSGAADARRKHLTGQFLFFWLPISIFLGLLLATNWYKFDSPFNTGYTQWIEEQSLFSADVFAGVFGFLASKQKSVFLHFPVLVFALFGWPAFFRKHRTDALLIAVLGLTLFLINSAVQNWSGESSYGPRYLLPILPLLSIPFIEFLEWLNRQARPVMKWIASLVVAGSLAYSLLLQVSVNTLPFFFWYKLFGVVEDKDASASARYLRSHHFGTINIDFIRYAAGHPSPFARDFVSYLTVAESERLQALESNAQLNYYWFPSFLLMQ